MTRILCSFMFVFLPVTMASALDTVPQCKGFYASMPLRVRNQISTVLLNARTNGKDVFRQGNATLIAEKPDNCTISLSYYEKDESSPQTCKETVRLCANTLVQTGPTVTAQTVPTSEVPSANQSIGTNKSLEEMERADKEQAEHMKEELKKSQDQWENKEETEEFFEVIIKIKENGDKSAVLADVKSVGGVLLEDEGKYSPRSILVKISKRMKKEIVKRLKENPNVEYFENNGKFKLQGINPNDPIYPQEYWAQKLGMPNAWGISTGGSGVTVAILDTGVSWWNDLATNYVQGYNFVNNTTNTSDIDSMSGHGTGVASVLGSIGSSFGECENSIAIPDGNGGSILECVNNG